VTAAAAQAGARRPQRPAGPRRSGGPARSRETAEAPARPGLWHLVDASAPQRHLPLPRTGGPRRDRPESIEPAQLRLAPEELGPTFMEPGQVLSTRAD